MSIERTLGKTPLTAITLNAKEWDTVCAALLCLRDHDDNRKAHLLAEQAENLRVKIRRVLGSSGTPQAGITCWHRTIDDSGICKDCGKRAAIHLDV